MTVKDLIESGLIQDNHRVCVKTQIFGSRQQIIAGRWYQDNVLELMDREVKYLQFKEDYLWIIWLKP